MCVSFQVVKEDSGNYSCGAPKTRPSSIDVFVSPGEKERELFPELITDSV